jgi:hypothetical protein
MATRVWESAIIRAPIGKVWASVRPVDFRYLGTVVDVNLEGKAAPSMVGGVRVVSYKDKTVQKIKLLELSDSIYSVTWELIESTPPISFMSAVHTIHLRRITESDSTFIEWTTDFSRDASNEVLADARFKQLENFNALDISLQPTLPEAKTAPVKESKKGAKAAETKMQMPKLQRQLSLNSKTLLQKAFGKLDSKGTGTIDREAAIDYYQKVCTKADVQKERASMILADFKEKKITFSDFSNFFKAAQLPDQKLETVLESLGFA